MNLNSFLLLTLALCSMELFIHSELLIVKKNPDGRFAPLNKAESLLYDPVISQIRLKYQWPMCIASNLNENEKNELLTSGKSCAEELFIQKKLKESISDLDLHVVFIPTALYELFCLCEFCKNRQFEPYVDIHKFRSENSFEKAGIVCLEDVKEFVINLAPILNRSDDAARAYYEICATYAKMNNLFFIHQKKHLYFPSKQLEKKILTFFLTQMKVLQCILITRLLLGCGILIQH